MKLPRVRLAWIMACIALLAIDLGVLRANHFSDSHWNVSLMVQGVLPMVNALLVGALISRQRPKYRLFFMGFEIAGAMALVSFAIATNYPGTYQWIDWYAEHWIGFMERTVTRDRTTWFIVLSYAGIMVMFFVPGMMLALMGGLLTSRIARAGSHP